MTMLILLWIRFFVPLDLDKGDNAWTHCLTCHGFDEVVSPETIQVFFASVTTTLALDSSIPFECILGGKSRTQPHTRSLDFVDYAEFYIDEDFEGCIANSAGYAHETHTLSRKTMTILGSPM
jgi:hypothetical protein